MLLPPSVVTSASPTPEASTRWRMIVTAWFICSVGGRGAVVGLRLEDDLRAALEVERELGRPGALP